MFGLALTNEANQGVQIVSTRREEIASPLPDFVDQIVHRRVVFDAHVSFPSGRLLMEALGIVVSIHTRAAISSRL